MDLYAGSVSDFEQDVACGRLVEQLEAAYSRQVLTRPNESEVRAGSGAWLRSRPTPHRSGCRLPGS